MNATHPVDAARLALLLNELRLPAIKVLWPQFAEQSDKEGWPAAQFLATIAEHEIAERGRRRIERHLAEARLPPGKTFDDFDFQAVPMVSKAQVSALAVGDGWLGKGANYSCSARPAAEEPSCKRSRPPPHRKRMVRPLRPNHRPEIQVARRELDLEVITAPSRRSRSVGTGGCAGTSGHNRQNAPLWSRDRNRRIHDRGRSGCTSGNVNQSVSSDSSIHGVVYGCDYCSKVTHSFGCFDGNRVGYIYHVFITHLEAC